MKPPRLRPAEVAALAGGLVVAAFLVAFGALHYGFYTQKLLLDTPIYERYGDAIVHDGDVPYRDFSVEYPPGALPVFAAPSLAAGRGDFTRYEQLFEALMLLCGAGAAACVAFVLTRQGASLARLVAGTLLAGLAPLALGPVVLSRFDLWPAALTIAALAALVSGRPRLGAGLLGGAIAAKLYPAVLVPLVLAYVWRQRGRRQALVCGGIVVAVVAAIFLPFVLASPSGVWESVSGHARRPLQIESVGASFLLAAHQTWDVSLTEASSHGSDNLVGTLPDALASTQSLLAAVTLLCLWIAFARGDASRDRLLRYAAAAVCAFVALSKVLSPQYLIWLMPLVPLVRGRRGAVAGALFLASMVLTQIWFPYRYIELVYGLDARASWLVLARDLLLVALLLALVWPRRAPRAGVSVVGALAAGAAAAVGAAAVAAAASNAPTHGGLLHESGVASRCSVPSAVPEVSAGSVAYDTSNFVNRGSRASCVTVVVTAPSRVQVFSAAYSPRFDPADPQRHYVGDPGRCTNVPDVAERRLAYAFEVAARARFVVEVEDCGTADVVPPYVLDVRNRVEAPAVYASATAERQKDLVDVRWRTVREAPEVVFGVYRDAGAGRVAATFRPVRGPRAAGVYTYVDRRAPLVRPLRYWLLARARGGAWSWHGPVETDG